jgi:hypothetical protein
MTTIGMRDIAAWSGAVVGDGNMKEDGRTEWNEHDFWVALRERDEFLATTPLDIADETVVVAGHAKVEAMLDRALGAAPTPAELRLLTALEWLAPEWVARVKGRRQ